MQDKKSTHATHALKVAMIMSGGLIVIKLLAFIFSGSLIVLASLFDSIVDTVMSMVNFKISQVSNEEADTEHPFGHGGFEVVGALVQGSIMAFFGVSLFIESGRKVFDVQQDLQMPDQYVLGAIVLLFSAFGGFVIQKYLHNALKAVEQENNRSLALEADQAHYLGDVIANVLSAIGIFLVWYTKVIYIDYILGGVAAFFLIKTAYPILKKSYTDIVHQEADPVLQKDIATMTVNFDSQILGVHNLRSRELGPTLFIDFHMSLKGNMTLEEAHELGEKVEALIVAKYPRADVIIHLDPESEEDHQDWEPSYKLDIET